MEDILSDILRLIRLKGCVYFARDFWSPWAMQMEGGAVAQFHVVLRGQCVIESKGRKWIGAPGDVFLFPRGQTHTIADEQYRTAVRGQDFMQSLETNDPLFAEGEELTQLICGHYEYRTNTGHPLIEELPAVIHIKSFESYSPETINSVLPALIRELKNDRPGAAVVVEKLAEIFLVQVLRAHYEQGKSAEGFLAAMFDKRLTRALRMIHSNYREGLTLDDLAAAAGMSRSAFALQFKSTMGVAPVAYLANWRMCQANDILQLGDVTLSQVADRVGYQSDVSFSRAFKRQFGKSPSAVRQQAIS
ncbi:MAG: AraC family transcriptional regulator [Alphaproteobacteria bacterium]|nr:AraC family transcriptional regulator [Alphaproteobacteria bacterium]